MTPSEAEILFVLKKIESGEVTLSWEVDEIPPDQTHMNVTFDASNGWKITVFNDGGEFDYIDRIDFPAEGWGLDFDDMPETLKWYRPPKEQDWTRWGFAEYEYPGVWPGWKLKQKAKRPAPAAPTMLRWQRIWPPPKP